MCRWHLRTMGLVLSWLHPVSSDVFKQPNIPCIGVVNHVNAAIQSISISPWIEGPEGHPLWWQDGLPPAKGAGDLQPVSPWVARCLKLHIASCEKSENGMKLERCQEASLKNGSDFLKIICSTKNSSGCDFFEIIICFEYPIQVQEIMPHRLRLPLLRLRSSSVAQRI